MASPRSTPFGELLRRTRKAAGLTQAELAERAGLSWRGINDLERGVRQTPRRDTVALLVHALALSEQERDAFEAAAQHSSGQAANASATPPPREAIPSETAAPTLPTGTVTFLFTDLEGSTHLLQQLGATHYATLRDTHHRLLRAACATHGGREVDSQGDSFFFAFPTAAAAVAAAVEAQRAIATQRWPAGVTVRVRMGLHTGAPMVAGEHYVGLDVHRAARIGAAGHGGQVLLSQTTADLALDTLPGGATLRDLGAHRLKDLQRPEHLWQLAVPNAPGLPVDFPQLQSLDTHPHNLPIQLTPLVGRERDVVALCALLQREEVRLVTLTGVGGTGKTRLALQVAAELVESFADGVWFVRLSRLTNPELVVPTIAQTLGVREAGGQPIAVTLAGYLHTKQVLLVLDNFEQVALAAPAVAELLRTCAGLKVLVTSRVGLHLRGEKQYRVPPLPLPDPAHLLPTQELVQQAAVALFIQCAQDADATFALSNATVLAIAAICARLDGLPLAIELVAAKVRVLPPPALLARLEHQLPLLTGGARDLESRQQTMRNTLAWSEALLSPEQQRLFQRLSVFVGSFTLEAAEMVCTAPDGAEPLGVDALEGLEVLMDQNLVQHWMADGADSTGGREEGSSETRFRMLVVVREYALERLEASGEAEHLRSAHAGYFLAMAVAVERELSGPHVAASLGQLEQEHDNFRAALGWARGIGHTEDRAEIGLQLAAALSRFWRARGHFSEGRSWLEELLHATAPIVPNQVHQIGDRSTAEPRARVSAVAWARAADALGWLALWQRTYVPAATWLEAAATQARAAGDRRTAADALFGLGDLALQQRNLAQAATWLEASLTLAREDGSSLDIVQAVLCQQGWVAYHQGDLVRATATFQEGYARVQEMNNQWSTAIWQVNLGEFALLTGDLVQADTFGREALHGFLALGTSVDIAPVLELLAMVAGADEQSERAVRLLGAATTVRMLVGTPPTEAGREDIEQETAVARLVLGEERWAAAFAAGRALSIEEAIAEALGERR